MNIRFRFDPEKLVQALAYFSERGISDLDKMKAAKLLFHADKYHLLKYGRPVIGDQYACMDYGPVPSTSLNIMNDVIANDPNFQPVLKSLFDEYLEVHRGFWRTYPVFRAKRRADTDVFSDSDVEALDWAIANYGEKSAMELSKESHQEPAWRIADQRRRPKSSVMMDYRHFFEDHPEAINVLRFMEAQQEERDFESLISYDLERDEEDEARGSAEGTALHPN